MTEDWLTQALTNRWSLAAVAYLLGAVSGWLFWRAVRSGAEDRDDGDLTIELPEEAEAVPGDKEKNGAPASAKLSALEKEIKQAKSILETDAEEHAAMADILSGLDEAVKRANGRLKLILKSIKNGRNGD